jgi:tripartite-type tricarboxylate transporter receptor subunit TctC
MKKVFSIFDLCLSNIKGINLFLLKLMRAYVKTLRSSAMTKITRRAVLAGLSACAAMPTLAKGAWPEQPITLVHGFPAGGPVDVLSRILAEPLGKHLGQPVIVEPKPGATGTASSVMVSRASPDGYTLMAVPGTFAGTAAIFRSLPYHPIESFTFISSTAEYPLVLVTHADSDIRTLADVISIAQRRATPLQFGTAGTGSIQHLTMELFAQKAKIKLQHIPYQGGMPAITDLLGKRLDLVIDPPTALVQFVKEHRLRALAVTGAQRFFDLPDVLTMPESGFPGLIINSYQGLAAPARLPADITAKLNHAIAAVLADPTVIEKLKKIGNSPRPSSPEEYKARLVADIALWKGVVEDAHLAPI